MILGGRYRLEREVGRGGMGVVWLGHDELLGRAVAMKKIGPERAEREAQLAARLHHPHVVAVFDLIDDPIEGHWLVMEYVDGPTLAALVSQQVRLSAQDAATLLVQVADALVAAKAAGITHRDVKPANVLVTADGVAKLSDFGIARAAADASATQTDTLMGSPAYVAPESASGEPADHAGDVWSFGAMAYYVLTGVPPYVAENALGTLYRIVHEDPPSAPEAGWLAPLFEGTLVKDPNQRWTIEEVDDFLRTGRVPTGSTRILVPVVTGPAPRRPPRGAIVLAAVIAVVVLGALVYAVLPSGPTGPTGRGAPAAQPSTTPTAANGPTAAGMKAFIRSYVATVSDNPAAAWTMLTPKFQRASGGRDTYLAFWDAAKNGRVRSISANPADLMVRYQVHFAHFHNGPGPTILELVFTNGRYLIDGESTKGFTPASQVAR